MSPMRRLLWTFVLLLAGCMPPQSLPAVPAEVELYAPTPAGSFTPTSTTVSLDAEPVVEVTPEPSPSADFTLTPAVEPPAPPLCSPLQDTPFESLTAMISNPYHPPRPGYDDPHAGIDLAVQLPGSQVAVSGHLVQAAIAGRVAMVAVDRFPFGNALIVETPLDSLPGAWIEAAALPTPAPTLPPLSALTCPPYPALNLTGGDRRSLYTLYAHLQEAPEFSLGDPVACGQVIGAVGASGNALNPHLHYETRAAPAGIQLAPIAHYDAGASAEEMSAYCLWSVSGMFQLVDPHKALGILAPAP